MCEKHVEISVMNAPTTHTVLYETTHIPCPMGSEREMKGSKKLDSARRSEVMGKTWDKRLVMTEIWTTEMDAVTHDW